MSVPQAGGGPITSKADLVESLSSGSKPKSEWRIGTEHEKFGFDLKTLAPLPYEGRPGVKAMLEGLKRFGWEPINEGPYIIGLKRNGAAISLEPGGHDPAGNAYPGFVERYATAYAREVAVFLEVITGRAENPSPVGDSLVSLVLADACEQSRRTGLPVAIDPAALRA